MAKRKSVQSVVHSFTIRGTNKVVLVGDCVLMRPEEVGVNAYVGRVEQIMAGKRNNLKVRVRWYYRPEETEPGRRLFHGAKELLLSDHMDIQNARSIFGKCTVHSFEEYSKLKVVGDEDYYWRLKYDHNSHKFMPEEIPVYCICEMPYNPDHLMIQCEECLDWFHPQCVDLKPEEAKRKRFVCSDHPYNKDEEKAPHPCNQDEEKSIILENEDADEEKKPISLANGNPLTCNEDLKKPTEISKCKGKVKRQRR